MIGVIFMPTTFSHFAIVFTGIKHNRNLVVFNYLISVFFTLIVYTPFFALPGKPFLIFPYWPAAGMLFPLHLIHFFLNLIFSYFIILRAIKRSSGVLLEQLMYVLLGTAIGFLGGLTNYFCWYRVEVPPFLNVTVSFGITVISYAIIKYRLMDIKVVITRTTLFLVVYSLILGFPFAIAGIFEKRLFVFWGEHWWVFPLSLMALLATGGPFIYIYLNRKAERALMREQRRYQDILKQAAVGMTRIRDLHRLLNLIVHIITKAVRVSHSSVYLYDPKSEQFLLEAGRNIQGNQPTSFNRNSTLMVWLKEHPQPFVYEEMQGRAQENPNLIYREIEEQMRQLNAAVIVPSMIENHILGFLVLGEKRSKQIYTDSDLEVFFVLASQAALAIENARFILEAKFIQEQIAHTEKMATIGTMADGLSHQINNRFHALSLITEDTIDSMKNFDTSAYDAPLQDIFNQISYALGRIQVNVQQGGEVVEGMLKYTRKGGQEREPLTLEKIINGTQDMLRYKVKLDAIDIVREFSPDIPRIKGNLVQLQEVFFNLMDNAYDSMMERKAVLQEENYRGKIIIRAEDLEKDCLRITIEDNGLGVKKEDQKKLFTPFFTTKISSHKGTGLGLYVIRRIIVDMHEGEVNFESEYKRGTRFLIDLPIVK